MLTRVTLVRINALPGIPSDQLKDPSNYMVWYHDHLILFCCDTSDHLPFYTSIYSSYSLIPSVFDTWYRLVSSSLLISPFSSLEIPSLSHLLSNQDDADDDDSTTSHFMRYNLVVSCRMELLSLYSMWQQHERDYSATFRYANNYSRRVYSSNWTTCASSFSLSHFFPTSTIHCLLFPSLSLSVYFQEKKTKRTKQ